MTGPAVLGWVLAGLGTLMALVTAFHFFRRDMHADKFLSVVEKLMNAGNYSRARRLCRANVFAPVGRITEVALGLRLDAKVLVEGEEADYRSAPETVPFEDRVREALAPSANVELDRGLRMAVVAAFGLALSAGSLWPPTLDGRARVRRVRRGRRAKDACVYSQRRAAVARTIAAPGATGRRYAR